MYSGVPTEDLRGQSTNTGTLLQSSVEERVVSILKWYWEYTCRSYHMLNCEVMNLAVFIILVGKLFHSQGKEEYYSNWSSRLCGMVHIDKKRLKRSRDWRHLNGNSRDANPPYLIGRLPIFVNIFVHFHFDIQIWQPPYFGKFCAIAVAWNFKNVPIFCWNPPYFLDVDVGISGTVWAGKRYQLLVVSEKIIQFGIKYLK